MYSIGEFSKINRITPKTLRHYDKLGLLKPVKVDDWTGYRYYSAEQLPIISKILMFRDFGFSLHEILELMNNDQDIELLLKKRVSNLESEIDEQLSRLSRVREFLQKVEGEKTMNLVPVIKSLPEVIVASMRTKIPSYDTYFDIVPRMGEYMNSVGVELAEPAYCFTIYHDGEYKESDIDVEICEAVVKPCKESEKVKFKTINSVSKAAIITHVGPYSTIRESYNKLFQWISENGYIAIDNPRESYIDGIWNKDDSSEWITDIQVPVKKGGE